MNHRDTEKKRQRREKKVIQSSGLFRSFLYSLSILLFLSVFSLCLCVSVVQLFALLGREVGEELLEVLLLVVFGALELLDLGLEVLDQRLLVVELL